MQRKMAKGFRAYQMKDLRKKDRQKTWSHKDCAIRRHG